MTRFTDEQGDDWTIKVNAVSLSRVQDRLGVNFSADAEDDGGPFMRIACESMFCFEVLYVLCQKQCEDRGLSDEDFSERLVGDTLGKAQACLLDAIADFHPTEARRSAAKRVARAVRAAESAMLKRAGEQLDALNVDELIREALPDAR